jgi:hypothetical protein
MKKFTASFKTYLTNGWPDFLATLYYNGSWRNIVRYRGQYSSDPGQGPVVGSCGHGNEPCRSLKGEKFLELMTDSVDLKVSVPKN